MRLNRFLLGSLGIVFISLVSSVQAGTVPILVFTPDIHASMDRWPANTVAVQKDIMNKVASLHPAAMILGGDTTDRGARDGDWSMYLNLTASLAGIDIYPTLGNHELYNWSSKTKNHYVTDIGGGKKKYDRQFGPFYAAHAPAARSGYYYSINNSGVHVISLDMHIPAALSSLLKNGSQYQWLVNDLKSKAATSAKYIVVVSHLPIHPTPCGSGMPGDFDTMRNLFVKLDPLFKQYKVSVVAGGHLHCYKRNNSPSNTTTLPYYVVAGTSGAPNSTLGYLQFTVGASSMRVEKIKRTSSNQYVVSDSFTVSAR
jgi:hypothetical protein